MTPEMERIIAELREWYGRSATPDQYARRLGEGESIVADLLRTVDREQGR